MKNRKRCRFTAASLLFVAFTAVDGFGGVATMPEAKLPSSSSRTRIAGFHEPQRLPVWLRRHQENSPDSIERLLKSLQGFFTSTETLKLRRAIEETGEHAAGAAAFCLLLSETMEMGLNALTAAAFHYCNCVRSRRGEIPVSPDIVNYYGEHVMNIVNDAGRLKELEIISGTVQKAVAPDELEASYMRSLLLTETRDWRSLAIRCGACLFRLRGIIETGNRLDAEAARAAREAFGIYSPLASRLGMHRLKNELEGAAFRILYRRQHERVQSLHLRRNSNVKQENTRQDMENVLEEIKLEMTDMLDNDVEFSRQAESFEVSARVKEPYSMWKKMIRNGYDHVLKVPDALALRIVLTARKETDDEPEEITRARERALCYYAQKLCMERWKPTPDPRFKDYIENPKPNGYQSLHYTGQTANRTWTLEVQVRSAEMHQVAEFGLASHWDYKLKRKSEQLRVTLDHSSQAYLKNVQQWHWQQHGGTFDASPASSEPIVMADIWQSRERSDRIKARTERLTPYLKALDNAKSDLVREQVFCFLDHSEHSTMISLPAGACVLDALRQAGIRQAVARRETVILNGQETSVTRQLSNGDVLVVESELAATV